MSRPAALAACVGLACLALAHADGSASTPAGPLERIAQARDQGRWLDALDAIERALAAAPDDPALYRLRVLTLSDLGSAYRAWDAYRQRPELFEPGHVQRLESEYLARLVNWSLVPGDSEQRDLEEALQAEARLHEYLDRSGTSPERAPVRVRLDRLILLHRLGRHAQLRREVQALQADGVTLPDYVLEYVGASLLAEGHPDEAIPVLEAATRNDPARSRARTELAYAFLESEQPRRALDYLQAWQAAEPAWGQAGRPYENWARHDVDLTLGMIRGYTGDLPGAQRDLEALVAMAPANGGLQTSLGTIYGMRGWSERALERHRIAHTLEPRAVPPRIGMAESWMRLQRTDIARPIYDDLERMHHARADVRRAGREWRAHRGWHIEARAAAGRSRGGDGASPLGNDDRSFGLEVESRLLRDRWRLFAFAERNEVDYDEREVDPLWLGAGLRYRFDRLDAEAYLGRPNDDLGGTSAGASVGWRFDDRWYVSAHADRNAADASSQARAAGIAADRLELRARFRPHERTALDFGVGQWRLDDGNRREDASVSLEQRLLTRPTWQLDGLGGLYASRGRRDDVPYFSPARDRSLELGLRADQLLWRRYERHVRHRLTVSVGDYWQDGYGSALVPAAAYRHEWRLGAGRILEYGVSWSRPVYDGGREKRIGFDAALYWGE
ncbi:poly-beta-1,6 N-acetyl-D-glucosamine export porin PgaA [Luteimonas huabeiensis]|uniref:poly-beta-1,6 N-acetyl-D-glucosamine export porin PgaA n=1 Tax=Luteimonas huabeiensis TaxID=1244513 RepID=UPI00046441C5|nr:poly-beta-1,6 N-acetyl-D-glucosamine export porin PgaA [Luteimonas huabeiensis]